MSARSGAAATFSVFSAKSSGSFDHPKDQKPQMPSTSLKMSPKAWDEEELKWANALGMYSR
jgi:hypothetical protein